MYAGNTLGLMSYNPSFQVIRDRAMNTFRQTLNGAGYSKTEKILLLR